MITKTPRKEILFLTAIVFFLAAASLFFFFKTRNARRQAELVSAPHLEIAFVSDSLKPGQPLSVSYELINKGTHSAKLISGEFGIRLTTDSDKAPLDTHPDILPQKINLNSILMKDSTYKNNWTSNIPLSQSSYDSVISLKNHFYFFAKIQYTDESTGKPREYHFNVQIDPLHESAFKLLHDVNYPVGK